PAEAIAIHMAGLFITVEGIDGAGKTTHLAWLRDRFEARQREVVTTREPGGTALGESLRALLLRSEYAAYPETEAMLMFAARREHLERVILPALQNQKVVLCDRFTDATFAYQGYGSGVSLERLEILEAWVQRGLQPDLTFFFDVPVTVGQQRMGTERERDRFERERAGYLERAARYPDRIHVIDSTPAIDVVRKSLERVLARY